MNTLLIKKIINLLRTIEYYIPDDKYEIISSVRKIIAELQQELD